MDRNRLLIITATVVVALFLAMVLANGPCAPGDHGNTAARRSAGADATDHTARADAAGDTADVTAVDHASAAKRSPTHRNSDVQRAGAIVIIGGGAGIGLESPKNGGRSIVMTSALRGSSQSCSR